MSDDGKTYGTVGHTEPVTRADFERAVRALNASDLDTRDALLKLVAHVVALTDEATRRLDGVEPAPAPEGTPAAPPTRTVKGMVSGYMPSAFDQARVQDLVTNQRTAIDTATVSKYEVEPYPSPCVERMPICKARCCKMTFPLSSEDLDEGVVRWDYGQPYLIRQRASDGYCVHNNPGTGFCTIHENRPRVCRQYDCKDDERIWIDYDKMIPAPFRGAKDRTIDGELTNSELPYFDLLERVRVRHAAVRQEIKAIRGTAADAAPMEGPVVDPKQPLMPPK